MFLIKHSKLYLLELTKLHRQRIEKRQQTDSASDTLLLAQITNKINSFIYTLNTIGERTPPCFTPLEAEKVLDVVPFHFTLICWLQ